MVRWTKKLIPMKNRGCPHTPDIFRQKVRKFKSVYIFLKFKMKRWNYFIASQKQYIQQGNQMQLCSWLLTFSVSRSLSSQATPQKVHIRQRSLLYLLSFFCFLSKELVLITVRCRILGWQSLCSESVVFWSYIFMHLSFHTNCLMLHTLGKCLLQTWFSSNWNLRLAYINFVDLPFYKSLPHASLLSHLLFIPAISPSKMPSVLLFFQIHSWMLLMIFASRFLSNSSRPPILANSILDCCP